MPFNGSGSYSPPTPQYPAVALTTIKAADFNTIIGDVASALSLCVTKDGQQTMQANLAMGGYKVTGLANGTAATDAAAFGQLAKGLNSVVSAGGTVDAITVSFAAGSTVAGQMLAVAVVGANTIAAPTLKLNSDSAYPITVQGGLAGWKGMIPGANFVGLFEYTSGGTWELLNPVPMQGLLSVTTTYSAGAKDNTAFILATNAATVTLPASTGLSAKWYVNFSAAGGALTFALASGTDKINGGTAGASLVVAQSGFGIIHTDGTGNFTISYLDGTTLTSLNASNLSSGTVPAARLGSGTANSGTYLRGDGTWAAVYTGNYFGDGSDGAITVAANTNWATSTGVDDTGVVVKNFTSLTINSGVTVTAANRAKVMLLYCTGNVTVNGTLHMNYKGATGTPASDLVLTRNILDAVMSHEVAASIFRAVATGGSGGAGVTTAAGNNGGTAANGTGGGGSGGSAGNTGGSTQAGASGTAWCGGAGSGGGADGGANSPSPGAPGANNTSGGSGGVFNGRSGGPGAGNPIGGYTGTPGTLPQGGGGGTLIIVAAGNVVIGASGLLQANGADGGQGCTGGTNTYKCCGGGGAGGGRIIILYGGTYTNSGTVQANGGAGGALSASGTASSAQVGGAGGAGSITTSSIANF